MDAKNPEFLGQSKASSRNFPTLAITLAGVAIVLAIIVLMFDWNWFRGPVARYWSHKTGRQVRIGDLRVHLFSLHPNATVAGLRISNPSWAPVGDTAKVPRLYLQVKLWPLFAGHFVWEQVTAQSPNISLLRDAQGRATWEFGTNAAENAKPLSLPPIRRFLISNGVVQITDAIRQLTFGGTLSASQNGGTHGTAAFQMLGQGLLNKHAFRMKVTGGPLIDVDRAKPYPFIMDVRSEATHVIANAEVRHPFDLGQLEGNAVFAGANLADLYNLTGLALPRTGPYRISAYIVRDGRIYRLTHLTGTFGNSDLEGAMTIDVRTGRPFVTADLTSRRLDFVDLGPLVGGAPSRAKIAQAAAKAGIPEKTAAAKVITPQNQAYLLPDVPLNVSRVNQMDARAHYIARSIHSQDFPLRDLDATVILDHGILELDPVSFALVQGKVTGSATIDARKRTPVVSVDARVRDIKLEQFVAKRGDNSSMLEGTVDARAVLTGVGNSVHKAASTANGDFRVVVPGGAIRRRFAELMGISVDRAFLLSGRDQTNVRCIVADFQARTGVLTARNMVFDADVINVGGKGTVDLRNERMDIELQGHPKKLTFFRLRAPITLSGPLNAPNVGIKSGGIPAQAGAAIVLGAIATPFAAIFPFIDPGLAKNADCAALESATPVAVPRHRK